MPNLFGELTSSEIDKINLDKHIKFLEWLKEFIEDNDRLDEFGGTVISSVDIIIKIEQFQAEQKQVSDDIR